MHLSELAGTDPVSVYRSLWAAPDEAPMLVEQAVRTASGGGADPAPAAPTYAADAPPRLVLIIDQFEELFTTGENAEHGGVEREAFIAAL